MKLPRKALDTAIRGKNLTGATLEEELAQRKTTLLVFLRHFG